MSQQEYDSGSDQQKIVFSNLREQLTDHQHKNVLTVLNEPNGQDYHLFFSNSKVVNQTYLEKFEIGSRKSGIK